MSDYLNGEYIGDAVYAQQSKFGELVLSTGSDANYRPQNLIVLDDVVLSRLLKYVKVAKPNLWEGMQ